MSTPIYAYKGCVYEVDHNPNTNTTTRHLRFRDSGEAIDLVEYGEITLQDFKNIVDTYLNMELE